MKRNWKPYENVNNGYGYVQGYEAMHFQTAVKMKRGMNLILTTPPCMNYTRGYKTVLLCQEQKLK